MSNVFWGIVSFLIAFPAVLFVVFYILQFVLLRKRKMKAFGVTADVTTFFLFFSVPAVVYAFWMLNIFSYIVVGALLIGIALTIVEWKTKKEVLIMPLFRKIWRTLFLVLNLLYIGAFVVGSVQFIWNYVS